MSEINKIYHDIKSRCSSIKNAVELIKETEGEERKELLLLIKKASLELQESINLLEKELHNFR
jgi:hypothetical protein